MRLEPVKDWLIARAAVTKMPDTTIIIPNASTKGATRCYLIEEASVAAQNAGYKPGDFVVATKVYDMLFPGQYHRVTFTTEEIICKVHGVPFDQFTDVYGKPFVEPKAAE